ncbi:MAG: SDR family oxidoreductase [Rhodobacteraceae bacterium]|nr:SDR family oxidoreductase [Paracoccaceae bacterium]
MDNNDPKFISGQHTVVTGGAKGIGLAVSTALARAGVSVTMMGRDIETARCEANKLAMEFGKDVFAHPLDVAKPQPVEMAFRAAVDDAGPVQILVNNAGVAKSAPFLMTSKEQWDQTISVDLTGAFLCTHQVLPDMIDKGYGRIVNVGSTASHLGLPYATAYCAAKHGLLGLTRSLAAVLARSGVTVKAVCPGYAHWSLRDKALSEGGWIHSNQSAPSITSMTVGALAPKAHATASAKLSRS